MYKANNLKFIKCLRFETIRMSELSKDLLGR